MTMVWELLDVKKNRGLQFKVIFLWKVSKDYRKNEQSEISLNSNVYVISVDHSLIEDIINIQQYLMIKNNIK